MSFMKKLVGMKSVPDLAKQSHVQDNALGLMHLRKLFAEFRHPAPKATQKDQEDKLYTMLPLFCKVFENAPANEMTEKWGDILQFCSHVSKLMVTEIRRRASNQSTEAASCAIVKFLEIESSEDNSNGWTLLSTINLLSVGDQALIDCMTAASLPSTLVKCLYLFFDLPPIPEDDKLLEGCEFTTTERRVLLQKIFVQVLVRLCNHISPAEELAKKDDLSLLFSAISSWCPPQNVPWRKSAAEVLVTLSRHGLSPPVVKYIHDKGCVRHCLENMQRVQELSPLELVEMFVTCFCFLKDSSEVSQVLLDDFRAAQGYVYLSEFLLRLEQDLAEESQQALRNLVLLVGSLTTCGFTELRPTPASTGSLFQLPGFITPQPAGKDVVVISSGVSVRNLHAFQVLQSVFLKSNSIPLCSTILDVISSIYHQDNANFFILETQHTLSQFAEKIYLKPVDIQARFFELMEFIVFNLNFVPCKELISLSILVKSQHSIECSILCMKTLLRILRYHSMYRDVFREVGMLEVMVSCLHRYAALLKEPLTAGINMTGAEKIDSKEEELGHLVMEGLTLLLSGNSSNASVFRECGGARCAHNMVPYVECRQQALNIVQQLVLSPGGDDDMGTLLGLMPTAPIVDLDLKTHILKSLLNVLRESHRTRTVFRKVGGFVYVMSVLVSMEGCLANPPKSPWHEVNRKDILTMLRTVFSTLTVAMRYEPANAKFFATEVRYDSLTEAIRLLGCFSGTMDIQPAPDDISPSEDLEHFSEFFCHTKEDRLQKPIPVILLSCCLMIRYLYDMALDAFDKPITSQIKIDAPTARKQTSSVSDESQIIQSPQRAKRASTGSMALNLTSHSDLVIVHSGAVLSMFHLLPAIEHEPNKQDSLDLRIFTSDILKSLLRTERNQQIMCDGGFPHELLSHGSVALVDESHPLHPSLQYMFERLASQSLTPRDLRDFLRLGSPLSCRSVDDSEENVSMWEDPMYISHSVGMEDKQSTVEIEKKLQSAGGTVPLTRVKCLVSMTTPRDARMHGATVTPAFVEFDMSAEGFACLYLPSIAPQGPPTPSVVGGVVGTSEPVVIGGVGNGERVFPPQSGLTFSTWFCVDKFSQFSTDAHPVRLLTVVRNLQGRDENLICLSVTLASRDRALIVATQETYMPNSVSGCEQEQDVCLNDNTVRFWCPELTQEGQWHHLVLMFHRAGIMKNSSVSLFIDGDHANTQKLHYISPNLGGGGTASPTAFTSVFAYIGTPPQLRHNSRLIFRQGPCHLLEDAISSAVVQHIYNLGPTYIGSFQAAVADDGEVMPPFIVEEKVMFGVHAHAMSQMTIAKIRKVYNKVDSKSIAKQLAMSAHENATPIRILHNSAGHLAGAARTLGAILMGYLGVRTFCPRPVAKMLDNIGGTSALLGLIAMAKDVEGLYAAVKAIVCVVRSHKSAMWDMDRIRGYQLLAMLYKKKKNLLNSHILHLTFSLVGTVDSGRESSGIPNRSSFEDLLCDVRVWHDAPGDLERSLYDHFRELLTESGDSKMNHAIMRDIGLVSRMLHVLADPKLNIPTIQTIATVIRELLLGPSDVSSLLRFGQFLVSTIPPTTCSEKETKLETNGIITDKSDEENSIHQTSSETSDFHVHTIRLRNILLEVVSKIILHGNNTINQQMCEEIEKVLGFDWLLLFMQPHLHPTTVISALHILVTILRNPVNIVRFREGNFGGGWLGDTESVLKNQMAAMLGFNLGVSTKGHQREVNHEVCKVPGFQALQWLLPHHTDVSAVYFFLMALLLGQHMKELPTDVELNLDAIWSVIFGVPASTPVSLIAKEKVELVPDAALVILAMIRSMLNQEEEKNSSPQDFSITLMQFLMFLYHNQQDFQNLCMTSEFITGLAATLFPMQPPNIDSDLTSPQEEFKPFPESESVVIVKTPEKTNGSFLTGHQARKYIFDFLRTLVIDSFNQSNSAKASTIIDLVIDASPDHASRAQQKEYQTEILTMLMEHLLAADVLLGDQAAMPIGTGTSYSNMAHNVFYFASRVVDKLWQGSLQISGQPVSSLSACSSISLAGFSHGMFTREAKEVFEFISRLISQSKRKSSGVSLDPIYKCLNRTILFQLSRPIDSVSSQASVLEALHKLTNSRSLVFGPGNYDQEFLGCLCYCLLQLTEDPENSAANLSETKPRMTTWHVDPDVDDLDNSAFNGSGRSSRPNSVLEQGMHVVAVAAKRVWDELYICKKPALEEIFRMALNSVNSSTKNISAPDLNAVRLLIQEPASKIWVNYAENERKSSFMHHDKIQTQIQSVSGKLQRVGSGVLKFARKTKRELPLKTSPASTVHVHDFHLWTTNHVTLVKDVVEFQHKQYQESHEHMDKYLLEEWQQIEEELLRVRGLWGPNNTYKLDKWMLDMTEGPCRMRKKMMQNPMFFVHYPYRPDLEDSPLRYKVAISFDSKEYCEHYRPTSILGLESLPVKKTGDADVLADEVDSGMSLQDADIMNMPKLLPRSTSQRSGCDDEDQDDVPASEIPGDSERVEGQSENQQEGQQEGQTSTGEKGDNQAILRILGEKEKISHMFRCARIQGLDTSEGLLLFGKEHFYVIDGFTLLKTREIKDIDTLPPGYHDPIIPKSSMSSGGTMKRMCSKFAYEEVREVHKRRYLLQPIAIEIFSADGRNYLLAFPRKTRNKVFAKCLSVATSITDDAHQSVSGQKQNAKVESAGGLISSLIGEKSVTQRWERGEINNFQYLMHLNTLAGRSYNDLMQYPVFPWIIADYDSEDLDLNNPATFRDLSKPMGGQSPERLKQFEKRYNEWDDPQGETPPYHYGTHYSSAMIVASYLVRMEPFTQHFLKLQGGHFDLADRMFHSVRENWLSASKHNMADVKELIPEFFYLPDMLCNKNSFDLGSKQSGIQLNDVLLPPWAKGDPREFIRAHREALECDMVSAHLHEWIDLIFGYKQRGPAAVESVNVFHHLFYEGNVDIYSIDDPLKKNATIGFINNFGQIPKALFRRAHPQKKLNIRLLDPLPMGSYGSTNDKLFFHNVDNLKPSMQPIKELKSAIGSIFQNDKYVLAVEQNKVLIPPNFNKYLAWGYSDLSVRIGNYESDRATAVFECLDNGEVLCAACPNEKIFITGGFSCVVNVWEYIPKERKALLKRPLYGHTEPVTCLAASQAYNVIVSGSRDRSCIIWDLSRLLFVHQLRGHIAPVAAVTINDLTGDIATCAGTYLHVWNVNGEEIANTNTSTGRNQQILCVSMSQIMEWDSQNVILVGSSDGVVRMWSVEYVQVPFELRVKSRDMLDRENCKTGSSIANTSTSAPAVNIPKRTITRHGSCDSYNEARPAIDLLKDFKDPDYLVTKEVELGSSADSESHYISRMKKQKSDPDKEVEEVFSRLDSNLSTTSSASDLGKGDDGASLNSDIEELSVQDADTSSIKSGEPGVDTAVDTAVDALAETEEVDQTKSGSNQLDPCPSQSEPNLLAVASGDNADSSDNRSKSQYDLKTKQSSEDSGFVVIEDVEVQDSKKNVDDVMKRNKPSGKNHLREGFVWQRQLVFRSKLTMHTAFERKDNKDPAAITAITISRDHKTVFVGDARGRVFSWTVTDQPGRVVADHWMKDEGTDSCLSCNVKFSFSERRHHCRNCGQVFCSRCSRYETEIRRLHILRPVRVCQNCYSSVRAQQADTAATQRT